jgi:DNA-binding response OmpR family regulator
VLLARIEARLRRTPAAVSSAAGSETAVPLGDLVFDSDTHEVAAVRGRVSLNPKEYDLLALLLSQPGHLFPREEIVQKVWHQRYAPASRTLDVHVRHLRAKLEEIGAEVTIQTVRGVGYRLGTS